MADAAGWRQAGRLWRVHRGVYAVGHPALAREGRWHAAVLACRGSVLSHRPAGNALRIYRGELSRVEVTVPTAGTHRRPGILIHTSALPADEVTAWELESANARRSCALLTEVLHDLSPTDSPLEDAFRRKVIRRYRLPEPDYQAVIRGKRADLRWSAARLTVEIYGNHHVNPSMLQTDAARDNDLGQDTCEVSNTWWVRGRGGRR